jgi:agmatine/peptidylarginine deiminase
VRRKAEEDWWTCIEDEVKTAYTNYYKDNRSDILPNFCDALQIVLSTMAQTIVPYQKLLKVTNQKLLKVTKRFSGKVQNDFPKALCQDLCISL